MHFRVLFSLTIAGLWAGSAVAQVPVVTGVLNSGDYTPEVAEGALISIFGSNFAPQLTQASRVPLPTTLAGVTVELVDGSRTVALPLLAVSAGQINAQMPYQVSGSVQIRVRNAAGTSAPASVNVLPSAPKLLTWTMDGKGQAIALHSDYTPVNSNSPAKTGEVLILYLTGLGAVSPAVPEGSPAGNGTPGAPLNHAVYEPLVLIGGQPARVWYSGLAPSFAGLYQINVQVPGGVPSGAGAVAVSAAGQRSQPNVTMAVSSRWVAEATAQVGAGGGTIQTGAASLALSAGAVGESREITIYRDTNPQPGPGDKFRASDVVTVTGLPETLNAPLTVSLNLTAEIPDRYQPFIALRTSGGAGDGVIYLDARKEGGKLIATVPPAPAGTKTAPGAKYAAAADAGVQSSWTMWAVTGYYAIKSGQGHFRIVFPAEDLIEGGADEIADALESAYRKIADLGLDWGKRNGASSWPIDVSIEYFEDDRRDRWGEEGSTFWGVQRQGINLNAHFITRRENIENMRITAGHELFHLMQNLYDLESAPSTWLWMEEAVSTWFERRMAKDPAYVSATVAPPGSDNFLFLTRRGLEYPPGEPARVQEHGYGASMFIESLTRRHGDKILGQILSLMSVRAMGLRARPLYSPVAAIHRAATDVGIEWTQFCESYMAGQVYAGRPAFPAPELIAGNSQSYRWLSASDTGPVWEGDYPDLSAKLYQVDLRASFAANTKLTVSLLGGGPTGMAIIYRFGPGEWTRLGIVRDASFEFSNAERMAQAGQRLVIMVVNSRAVAPYAGRTRMTLRVRAGSSALDWLQLTKTFSFLLRMSACSLNTATNRESCTGNEVLVANHAGQQDVRIPITWSGARFNIKGRTTVMNSTGGNFDLDISGEMDAKGETLTKARILVKSYYTSGGDAGKLMEDWDIELTDYPLTGNLSGVLAMCANCWAGFQPRNLADWSKHIKINKMSRYSSIDGRETTRFVRIESVTRSNVDFWRL